MAENFNYSDTEDESDAPHYRKVYNYTKKEFRSSKVDNVIYDGDICSKQMAEDAKIIHQSLDWNTITVLCVALVEWFSIKVI